MPSAGKYQYVCHACHEWFVTDAPLAARAPKSCASCIARQDAVHPRDVQEWLVGMGRDLHLTDDDREFLQTLHIASD